MKLLKAKDICYMQGLSHPKELGEIIGKTAPIVSDKFSLAITNLEQNGSVAKHYHNISEEIYIFCSGQGVMIVNGEKIPFAKGDAVVIEVGDWHEIVPVDAPVTFYALSIPPFLPEDFLTQ